MAGFSFKYVGFIARPEHEGHSESASDSRSGQQDNLEKCPAHSCEQSRSGSIGPDCSACLNPTYAAKTTPHAPVFHTHHQVDSVRSVGTCLHPQSQLIFTHTHTVVFFPLLKPGCLASSFDDVILSQPSVVGLSPLTSPSPVRIIFRQSPCVYLVLSYIDFLLSPTLKNRCSPFTLHCCFTESLWGSSFEGIIVLLRIFCKYTRGQQIQS